MFLNEVHRMDLKKIIKGVLKHKKKSSNVDISESISNIRTLLTELTTSLDDLNAILKRICLKKK